MVDHSVPSPTSTSSPTHPHPLWLPSPLLLRACDGPGIRQASGALPRTVIITQGPGPVILARERKLAHFDTPVIPKEEMYVRLRPPFHTDPLHGTPHANLPQGCRSPPLSHPCP
jgi:hypothetical protein